jgi:Stress responsive A/B Barrel Domain
VIRNVVLAKLKQGVRDQDVEVMLAALRGIRTPGLLSITAGRDLGLRDGNWDAAVVTDLTDEESYHIYDADAEHNRIRRDVVAPLVERIERCQFQV